MKDENKMPVWDVYDRLCMRDPAWQHVKMHPKFKTLYDAWRATELRHKRHSSLFYTISWQRNWLPYDDWTRFRDYAMQ
jgi:hypothetical protein